LEFPTTHRIPISWIKVHACAPIRLRTVTELLPPGSATAADLRSLRDEAESFKTTQQITKRQKDTGIWGGNLLGTAVSKSAGIKEAGTVARFRQLLELGAPLDARPLRLSTRLFFRVLSRDPDPSLLFEYQRDARDNPELATWARELLREASVTALAQANQGEDPRVRGAAKRVVNTISDFLRTDLAESPLVKDGAKTVLHPGARPPTLFSVALLAYLPGLQRERAGFLERLVSFITGRPPSKEYVIKVGKKTIKPQFHILGDPLQLDRSGRPKDIPFALHWIELLTRLGMLEASPTAQRALANLLGDCDESGVWSPKNLKSLPKSSSHLADFWFPLELDGKTAERRRADVTFRLAQIAKLAGWELDYC
jgi:hypothetical protein